MASDVKTCNMALSHIGADARVSSIAPPDGSVEAGLCADFFDLARTELLEPGTWRFALHRESLALATNLSDTWTYAYVLPSDCLRALRVLRAGSPGVTVFTQDEIQYSPSDRDGADFDIEGETLYTNETAAVLLYVRDVTDMQKFTPSATSALSYLLASYLSGPIIKGNEGAKTGDAMRQRAMTIADTAATASANASSSSHETAPSIVSARA